MRMPPFKYVAADSVDEAVSLLVDYGDDAKILAGGQSLLPLIALRLARPEVLVDLKRCGLRTISSGPVLEIGAMTTYSEVLASRDVETAAPLLVRAIRDVAHMAVRNRGTIGGAASHADPAAEVPAVLVALGGEIVTRGPGGSTRSIPAHDFFVSHFTTALEESELVAAVRVNATDSNAWGFHEITRRHGDYALAGVAIDLKLSPDRRVERARIALFSVADRPVRVPEAEQELIGHGLDDEGAIRAAGRAASAAVEPPSDIHGSTDFRKRLVDVAVRRAMYAAVAEAGTT